MELEPLIDLITETTKLTEQRFKDLQAQSSVQSSQMSAFALELQKLSGIIEQMGRRFEYDLRVYLDGEKARLDEAISDLSTLKTDKTRISAVLWFAGATWGLIVTIIGLWFSGIGSALNHLFHPQQ